MPFIACHVYTPGVLYIWLVYFIVVVIYFFFFFAFKFSKYISNYVPKTHVNQPSDFMFGLRTRNSLNLTVGNLALILWRISSWRGRWCIGTGCSRKWWRCVVMALRDIVYWWDSVGQVNGWTRWYRKSFPS